MNSFIHVGEQGNVVQSDEPRRGERSNDFLDEFLEVYFVSLVLVETDQSSHDSENFDVLY